MLIMHGNLDTEGALLHAYYLEWKLNLTTWAITYIDCSGSLSRFKLVTDTLIEFFGEKRDS